MKRFFSFFSFLPLSAYNSLFHHHHIQGDCNNSVTPRPLHKYIYIKQQQKCKFLSFQFKQMLYEYADKGGKERSLQSSQHTLKYSQKKGINPNKEHLYYYLRCAILLGIHTFLNGIFALTQGKTVIPLQNTLKSLWFPVSYALI